MIAPDGIQAALRLAERLDRTSSPIVLTNAERVLLAALIREAVSASLPPLPHRGKNADRDHWVALDFHTRSGSHHRAKLVASDWSFLKLTASQVAVIATRNRAWCVAAGCEHNATTLRTVVEMHRQRYFSLTPSN